jgi:serine/threonine-protein kinase
MDRLAVGGMAEVFRAVEPRAVGEPRVVVVKRMLPAIAAEAGAHDMFEQEAKLGASIRHPNVVEVLGAGDEDGQPYLALEYVRGVDLWRLQRVLRRRGENLGTDLALFVAIELLRGIQAIHVATDARGRPLGVVHRDVSPSNVLLSVHGDVKLGDLGIARSQRRPGAPTHGPLDERAKGKLGYLAPEQVAGGRLDQTADIFSAAVVTAELLMNRPLFSGGSELAVLLAIRDGHIHPFVEWATGALPGPLAEVLVRALAKDPASRFRDARGFRKALEPHLGQDDEVLRRALARCVSSAMNADSAGAEDDLADRPTPLAEEAPTPVATNGVPRDAVTAELPHVPYRIRRGDGSELGPWRYAQVVEAVALGQIAPHDLVRVGDDEYRRVEEIAGLRRHFPPSTLTPSIQLDGGEDGPAPPDTTLPLAQGVIVSALARSALRRETGLWLCVHGGVRKEVYLADGVPEFVTSNLAGELLGEYLVSQRVISRGELDMALAVMPRFEGRLGETLTALGLVEPVVLFQHIATQVRGKLLDLFLWASGEASFYRGVSQPPSGFPLGLDPWRILDEGIALRLQQGLEPHAEALRSRMAIRVQPGPNDVVHGALPVHLRRILNALEQPRGIADLVPLLDPDTGRDEGAAHRVLVLLAHLGAIRLL